MGKIQELYDSSVRPMPPADRLQLAKLIIDDLAPSEKPVDVGDDWSEDDVADLRNDSANYADGTKDDPRGVQ